jgi:hypothetical protein
MMKKTNLKIGEITTANKKAIRSTIGNSVSRYTRYNTFCFRTGNSELLNVLYSLPPDMKKMMRNGK